MLRTGAGIDGDNKGAGKIGNGVGIAVGRVGLSQGTMVQGYGVLVA